MTPRKHNTPPSERTGVHPAPEAVGGSVRAPGSAHPTTALTPADEVMILDAPRYPRLRLHIALGIAADCTPVPLALAAARFVSTLHAADRKLLLTVDPARSVAGVGELLLVLVPACGGPEGARRLDRMVTTVTEAVAQWVAATLVRVEVVSEPVN